MGPKVGCVAMPCTTVTKVWVVLRLREWARSPTMNRPWQVGTWLLSLPLVQCALCMAVATATQPALLETSTRSTLRRRCFSKARPSTYLLHHPSTAYPSLLPLLRRKRQTKLSRSSARAHHIHDENEQGGCGRIVWNPSVFHRHGGDYGISWQVWLRLLRNRFPVVEGWHWFC